MPPVSSELAHRADDLLARRLRAGIWLIIAGNVLFTLADAQFRPSNLGILFVIQAVELLAMLGTVAFLRTPRRRVVTTWLGVVIIGFMCITTAISGVLSGETSTTLLSLSLITMGTATLLPWGFRPQLAVQSIAALAGAGNVYLIAGSAFGVRYLLIGVVVGFAATLYAAHAHDQHRREQARVEAVLEETRARQHQAELAHASRLSTLGEMAAGLAHELNQPLAAIVSWATGCLVRIEAGTADVDTLARVVSEISDEALRAGEVLRRIREFARSGEMRRERIDPNELVMSASRLARGDASEQGVSVWFELGREVPTVEVDRVQIEQVILNLFLNAFEAMSQTRRGERRLLVTTVAADADSIEVAIGDSGDGIPPAMEQKIFDPFFTTKEAGLGLGLAISRRIVEAHGGRLWATPNAGRGTTFHFTLPVAAREAWDAA
jgi:signal transduction histidine kinase